VPTYAFRCEACGEVEEHLIPMGEYNRNPPAFFHCSQRMERYINVTPGMSGLANALAGDRYYDGMRAPDGSDISTRSKHRQYMKDHNVTLADDFKDTWAKAAKDRAEGRLAGLADPTRVNDVQTAIQKTGEGYVPQRRESAE